MHVGDVIKENQKQKNLFFSRTLCQLIAEKKNDFSGACETFNFSLNVIKFSLTHKKLKNDRKKGLISKSVTTIILV